MGDLPVLIPQQWYAPAIVIVGLLLIVGVVSRKKAFQFVAALVVIAMFSPFVKAFVGQLDPWARALVALVTVVWIGGAVIGLLAGREVHERLAARFIEELLAWPFRALFAMVRGGFRLIFRRKSGEIDREGDPP